MTQRSPLVSPGFAGYHVPGRPILIPCGNLSDAVSVEVVTHWGRTANPEFRL